VRAYLCESTKISTGGLGLRFEVQSKDQTLPAFIIRHSQGVSGFINRCVHRELELDWSAGHFFDTDGGQIVCATHGALYDPSDGACISGPCRGQSLTVLAIEETDEKIYLVDPVYWLK
jgi:nitrite reductase/ring-hydroxylating ferredoxin subunit